MSKKNVKVADKFLAVFLTVLMLFSMMPVSIFANAAAETDYTITVKDEEANSISGATVDFIISVDGEIASDGSATTDENGAAVIDLAEYADEKADDKAITIDCNVTKDGYVAKETEITVEALNGNTEVTLEEIKVETVNVSVSKTGNGTVKINGEESVATVEKGSDVEIKIEPEDGAYIKSLTVNGKEKTVAEGEGYTESVTANEDISIAVTFSTKYTVSVKGEIEHGKITLDGKDIKSLTIDKDEKVKITVTPDKGYQIASVLLNDAEQLEANAVTFEKEVSAATTVEVSFVKVYEVTVTYTDNGIVKTDSDPDNEGGEISVVSGKASIFEIGKKFQIIAVPNENYRVSKVIINDDIQTVDVEGKAIGENEATYKSQKLDVNKNYSITVTFAHNVYNVTVNESDNGTVILSSTSVEHGGKLDISVTPKKGYNVKSLNINSETVNLIGPSDEGEFTYEIASVEDNIELVFEYELVQTALSTELKFHSEDALNYIEATNTYVFKKGVKATFETTGQGMWFYEDSECNKRIHYNWPVETTTKSWGFESNITIGGIEIWKNGKRLNVSLSAPINIVFDETMPTADIKPKEKAVSNGYYNSDVPVKITVKDPGDYSGIGTVTYKIEAVVNGETVTEKGTLYSYSETSDILGEFETEVIIDAKKFNSADVTLTVNVEDRAGNKSTDPADVEKFKINSIAPTVTVSEVSEVSDEINSAKVWIDGELNDARKDKHFKEAEIIVKINDRSDTFDVVSANNAVTISAKKDIVDKNHKDYGNTVDVVIDNTTALSLWTPEEDDQGNIIYDSNGNCNYVATLTLTDDARYEVSVGTYKNGASLSDAVNAKRTFNVDNKAPSGVISADESSWSELLTSLTFGLFKNDKIEVTATAEDEISDIYEIEYYKDNGKTVLSAVKLEELYSDGSFTTEPYTVGEDEDATDERFVVYARLVDKAGNVAYIGTNGIIYDTTESTVSEIVMPAYPSSEHQIYNDSIEVEVNVSEVPLKVLDEQGDIANIYSGIKEVKYEIVDLNDTDTITPAKTVFKYKYEEEEGKYVASEWIWNEDCYGESEQEGDYDKVVSFDTLPTYKELENIAEWNGKIRIDSGKYNSDRIKLSVTATDNAGNVSEPVEKIFSINVDRPIVNIEIGKNNGEGDLIDTEVEPINPDEYGTEDKGYYDAPRKAVITLIERATAFNAENATNAIKITAVDVNGTPVEGAFNISEWSSKALEGTDKTEFKAVVTFDKDANYTFNFDGYVNNAMNGLDKKSADTYTVTGKTPYNFTVDTTDPIGTVTVLGNTWDKLLSTLTFGLFGTTEEKVTADYSDKTSPIHKVEYYKTSNPLAVEEKTLIEYYEADKKNESEEDDYFLDYPKFIDDANPDVVISADEQAVVYFRIEDNAGNYKYISSDGAIIDETPSTVDFTPEKKEPEITLEAISYNIEDGDVTVGINVEEPLEKDADGEEIKGNYSGIQKIEYWVVKDGNIEEYTQSGVLYEFEYKRDTNDDNLNINGGELTETDNGTVVKDEKGHVPTQDMLKQSWSGSVDIIAEGNNSCDVVLYVKVIDNSGNEFTNAQAIDIDVTAPAIDIEFNNNKVNAVVDGRGYFPDDRTATVIITERAAHFDAEAATAGISITAKNAKGEDVVDAYTISEWTTVKGVTPDEDTHTATIHFAKDANYTFDISYTDKAGNKNNEVKFAEGTQTPNEFTVDTVKPFGTVTAKSKEGRETEWDKLITDLTFGFWSREEIAITSTSDDETSPIASVEYYINEAKEEKDASAAITGAELDAVKEWKTLEKLYIEDNKRFTVYLKITDNAGNYSYISTDGLIVDEEAPIEEVIAPEVTVMPEQPINGFYNGDVKVAIKVVDPLVKGSYSGLKTVSYKVYDKAISETEPTQSGTLYTFKTENPKQDQLLKEWTGQITVDSSKNNSNDVVIEVFAEDNSLNTSRDDVAIKIDVTAPEINVSYNNNKVDSNSFFKADRTATIVVTERNFNPDDVVVNITNTDGKAPAITKWKKTEGKGNLDNTKWTTTVTYDKDGDYTFDIEYTDLADNKCSGAEYGKSKAAKKFTIDKTDPVVSVSYDNNTAKNGKYFASGRTATIVIDEHNFDINRVSFARTSRLDGRNIATPDVSWNHSGDVHTATITYTADGDYTFDVEVDDKAGNNNKSVNYGSSIAGEEFTVDKTIAKPTINGVVNGKAYKDEVIPSISFSDINYDTYEVKLLRTRMGEKNVDVTSQLMKGVSQNATGGSGTYDTFDKIADNDGIYTLNVKVIDKAGNEDSDSVTFTVNRFGSVYEYSDYLIDRIEKRYITSIDEDLIITEYNADRLVGGSLNIEVTCDGKPLGDVQYDVSPVMNETVAVGSSGWFQYEYTISKANFESDGVYKIFVSSEDATGNKPENSNYEDKAITFMVDSTAPEITSITGLEEAIVNATEQEVKYTIFDTIGLKSIKVLVDGKQVGDTITDFSADLNNYSGSFKLSEKSPAQNVQIIVEDLAGNVTDTESETFTSEYVFNSKVTVSTNFFVRWYANKGLFWGSIAGFLALAAAIIFIVVKRRKKDEE